MERNIQTWSCNECGRRFRNKRRERVSLQKTLWKEYVFGKQTFRELKEDYGRDRRTLKDFLSSYIAPEKTHDPRRINLVVDATYFGERKEKTSWCAVVFRDPKRKENLWWTFTKTETTSVYIQGRKYLESLGYTILSVTGDGFGGLREAFHDLPFQMCHVHMERIVVNSTTKKPILEAGKVLLALTRSLHQKITSEEFKYYFKKYIERYQTFLNEKTINPDTGETSLTHEPLYKATMSIVRFLPYLFTFETNKNISRTTNSLEGHFSHIKIIVGVHRGLTRSQMERVLHSIFLASTIAPTRKKLKYVL